ncbi:hypothetical protein FKW77_008557 [Venturia effusa]|uniref:Uncharacterized protein n=1 Tax=Venturia effusa TaxID=50376 RepID=A0A517LGA9_9PEZI|nr:hypothetical protein FKW77_008557 [Venturia effusa]
MAAPTLRAEKTFTIVGAEGISGREPRTHSTGWRLHPPRQGRNRDQIYAEQGSSGVRTAGCKIDRDRDSRDAPPPPPALTPDFDLSFGDTCGGSPGRYDSWFFGVPSQVLVAGRSPAP